MKRLVVPVVTLLLGLAAFAVAQQGPSGGLQRVTHDSSLTGSGTTAAPLGVRIAVGGGLDDGGGASPLSLGPCSTTGNVLAWSGSVWACAANGTAITGTANAVLKIASSGTGAVASSRTDTGAVVAETLPITNTISSSGTAIPYTLANSGTGGVQLGLSAAAAGKTGFISLDNAGNLVVRANTAGGGWYADVGTSSAFHVRDHSSTDLITVTESTGATQFVKGGVGINAAPASGTAQLIVSPIAGTSAAVYAPNALTANTVGHTEFYAADSGTYDTTSTALGAIGFRSSVTASRSAGANGQTNYAFYADSSGASTANYSFFGASGSFYNAATGQFGGALGVMATPSASTVVNIVQPAAFGVGVDVTDSTTAQTATRYMYRVDKTGSYDTTAGALSSIGYYSNVASTRSAGSNGLTNYGGYFSATGAQSNYSVYGVNGVMFNAGPIQGGSTITAAGANNSNSIFSTAAGTAQTALIAAVNAANSGTFDTTSAPNTTYAVYGSVSATRSAGANGLTNVAAHFQAIGAQTNIALETSTGIVTFAGTVGLNTVGSSSTRLYNEAASADAIGYYFHNVNTASTMTVRSALQINDVGTYDTTASAASVYGVRISNTASRSAGANVLTDYGLYADITGAQNNWGLYVNNGNAHIAGATDIGSTLSVGGAENMNSHLINNVTDPVSAQDAATKNYVDTHSGSGTVTSINCSTGMSCSPGTPITTSGSISIAATGVTANTYAFPASVTVNAQGQLTAITAGAQPFTTAGAGLTSSVATVSIPTQAGVAAGAYTNASVTVDARGIVTAISSGVGGGGPGTGTAGAVPIWATTTTLGSSGLSFSSPNWTYLAGSSGSHTFSNAAGTLATIDASGNLQPKNNVEVASSGAYLFSSTTSPSGSADIRLYRTAANTATIDNAAGGAANLAILGTLGVTGTSTFAGLARFGGGTDTSAIGNNPVMVTNAGTTALAVRDSTNDVEVYLSASKPGVTGFGILGTSTAHALQLLANNTLGITISTTGGVTAANDLTVQNNTTLGNATSNKTTIVGRSYSSSAVSLGTCTNGSISGDDQAFTVSFSGVNSTCTVNFNATAAWASTPVCALTPGGTGTGWTPGQGPFITSQSTTALTFSSGANGTAPIFINGTCSGRTH